MAVALAFAAAIGLILSPAVLRWPVAVVLIALGVSRLLRHRHPRWAAMRVGIGGLTLWSFLMASAHGAGLMVVPVVVGITATSDSAHHHHHHAAAMATPAGALAATSIHALGYLLVTAILAVIVFEKLGVGVLRKAWVNLDLIWAGALVATGAVWLVL